MVVKNASKFFQLNTKVYVKAVKRAKVLWLHMIDRTLQEPVLEVLL